ncbi:MAG TPA: MBL fold metallo-hydrolase [Candidatus Ozemobacteraceae bacterium]|nr:MBL fold metallo-hydrolase [Candidatus Ozemobacteraceae bacterium]
MISVTFIGSGSQGNAALIEFGRRRFLLDAGLSCERIVQGLEALDVTLDDLDGLFITHDHEDHVKGIRVLLGKRDDLPIFATRGTLAAIERKGLDIKHAVRLPTDREFEFAGLRVWAFPVPHDAVEPIGFRFEVGSRSLAVATDLGHVTPVVMAHLTSSDILCLESNYDEEMLAGCSYPDWLKRRIKSRSGHLPNTGVRGVLTRLQKPLQHLILVHVSQEANTPQIVQANVAPLLTSPHLINTKLCVASQDVPTGRCRCMEAPMPRAVASQTGAKTASPAQKRFDFADTASIGG